MRYYYNSFWFTNPIVGQGSYSIFLLNKSFNIGIDGIAF